MAFNDQEYEEFRKRYMQGDSDQAAKAQAGYDEATSNIPLAQFAAGMGSALAGRGPQEAATYFDNQRKAARDEMTAGQSKQKDMLKSYLEQKALEQKAAKESNDLDYKTKKDIEDREFKREMLRNSLSQRGEAGDIRKERLKLSKEKKDDDDVQKLSHSLSGTQSSLDAMDKIEELLGGPIESFQNNKGVLYKDGKKVDLPGVSIPGLGRVTAFSDSARELNSRIGSVFNSVLKDRSGQAITNNEMERLKNEFGSGKFNTEAELINAVKQYKIALNKELQNRQAGFDPKIVEIYSSRGGRVGLQNMPPKQQPQSQKQQTVKMLDPKGNIREVPSNQVDAAIKAGGTPL